MKKVKVGVSDDFAPGQLKSVLADGVPVVLGRTTAGLRAIVNRCPHLGLPMGAGRLEGTSIVCPWHNSRFNLCTGENQDWVPGLVGIKTPAWSRNIIALGKKPTAAKPVAVIEENGVVYVEIEEQP